MSRKGRRAALTPEIVGKICEHLTRGVWRHNACALVGIHHTTLEKWLAKGRDELADACDRLDETGRMPRLGKYAELVVRIEAIEAEVESNMVGVVVKVASLVEPEVMRTQNADGSETTTVIREANPEAAFRAAAWWLERKRNLVYGRGALRVDLNTNAGTPSDEEEDPMDLVLTKLAEVENRLAISSGEKPDPDGETHE